jgi:pimeloyl-ACP methyl ester carboxylesterase
VPLIVRIDVDGRSVYAYTGTRTANPAQRSVVFLHGAANDHSVWSLQSRYFAHHGFNVFAVDLPGHGNSGGAALSSIAALSEWLIEFLRATKIATASLVGHSMGSLVALETAARVPALVEKIALIGTAVPMPVSASLLQASSANEHAAYEIINAYSHSATAQLGGNRIPGAWMLGATKRLMERSAPGVLHTDFSACNNYLSGLESAVKVSCPALLVLGKRDLMTPARAAAALAEKIPRVKTVALDGAGHALMSEQPDAVLDALIDFV